MASTQQMTEAAPRCTLCPAGCAVELVASGPSSWHVEYPAKDSRGVCARGSTLGELVSHRRRILSAKLREDGRLRNCPAPYALERVVQAGALTILLDAATTCEELARAAAWCGAWPKAKLCFVLEPAERELLLGTEAGGADYLAEDQLQACDGFVLIGDVFAANPVCSRGVFDRRREQSRTPVVAIDAARGTGAKFATHVVGVSAGQELAALSAVAAAAGVSDLPGPAPSAGVSRADDAGKALGGCSRLGVLVAAEYGRTGAWRQIGYVAGRLAAAKGGGVAPQTVGANALAAVRLAETLGTASLAEALCDRDAVKVAVGCDVVGMLGSADVEIRAAAAAMPNRTTDQAEVVLPVALPGEYGGTVLLSGAKAVKVSAMLDAPRGVAPPGGVVEALARADGVSPPAMPSAAPPLDRLQVPPPSQANVEASDAASADAEAATLLLGRQAMHDGCGALTAHGSWQQGVQPEAPVRINPEYAASLDVANLSFVSLRAGGRSVRARVQYAPELPAGTVVLPEGLAEARALCPSRIDAERGRVVCEPAAVELSR